MTRTERTNRSLLSIPGAEPVYLDDDSGTILHAIMLSRAEAREQGRREALEEVRAGVEGLNPAAFQKWWYGSVHSMLADDGDAFRASVLALLGRLSKGKDG